MVGGCGGAGARGGPNPPDGIGSHALGLSARHAQDVKWPSTPLATPRSRGLSGFGDNDIAASIKIHINHFTARPPFPLFVLARVSKASQVSCLALAAV